MSFELPIVPLGQIVKIKGGKRLPKGTTLQTEKNTHPYIRVRDMGKRYIPEYGLEYVPYDVFPSIKRYFIEENDVIISIVGTIGLVSVIDERFHKASQTENCAKLSGLDKADAFFLYYYLNSSFGQQEIKKATVGAVQAKLPLYNVEKISVFWPEKERRESIVNCLCKLDDKIELNCQTNQTLEQIAQAIFKSWFVDFKPVKAKIAAKQAGATPEQIERAAMCAISGKSLEQLKQLDHRTLQQLKTTAALFPDAMVGSELGEIPEGWEVKPLSQMIELIGGGTPKKSENSYWGGDIPWFSVKDAPNNGDIFVIDTEEKITELGLNKSSTKLLPEGVTIISARGTVGRLAFVGVPMAMNQSCYGVKGTKGIGPCMNYFNLKNAISTLKQNTHGAVFDTITRDTFDSVELVEPSKELKQKFEKLIKKLFVKIRNNLFESNELLNLRDTLLPKFLSGELLPDQNKSLTEAVC